MVRTISNYSKETRHIYDSNCKHTEWHRVSDITEDSANLGFGVSKRTRVWWEEKDSMGALRAFLTGFTLTLGGFYDKETRKVTDTEYMFYNSEVSEQVARETVKERQRRREEEQRLKEEERRRRDGERRREEEDEWERAQEQWILEEARREEEWMRVQKEWIAEEEIKRDEEEWTRVQEQWIMEEEKQRQEEEIKRDEEEWTRVQEQWIMEEEKQRQEEEKATEEQRIMDEKQVRLKEKLSLMVNKNAQQIYDDIKNYQKDDCLNVLSENDKMLIDAINFKLEPNEIILILLKSTFINQSLLHMKINELDNIKDENDRCIEKINLLDSVIENGNNAKLLLDQIHDRGHDKLQKILENENQKVILKLTENQNHVDSSGTSGNNYEKQMADKINLLVSKGALRIYDEINGYQEGEYKNDLNENHKLLSYAFDCNLKANVVNLLLIRNTFLNQGLLYIELNDLANTVDETERCTKTIHLLDSVIGLINDANTLLKGLGDIEVGNLQQILNDLKEEAEEEKVNCQELINQNQLQNPTAEERIRCAQAIANRATQAVNDLDRIAMRRNQEIYYRHT